MRIQKSHKQDKQEYNDLHETGHSYFFDRYGPGIHKNKLYVENKEDQCIQIIPDIELVPGRTVGGNTALVCLPFLGVFCPFDKDPGDGNPPGCKGNSSDKKND